MNKVYFIATLESTKCNYMQNIQIYGNVLVYDNKDIMESIQKFYDSYFNAFRGFRRMGFKVIRYDEITHDCYFNNIVRSLSNPYLGTCLMKLSLKAWKDMKRAENRVKIQQFIKKLKTNVA